MDAKRNAEAVLRLLPSRREAHGRTRLALLDRHVHPTIPGGKAGYKHRHGTSDGRFEALFEYERLDHRAKVVCLPCNNGWMNDLETAARPFLKEMIAGGGVALDVDSQRTVATWAAKTAMCVERTFPSATQAIPDGYYESLYANPSEPSPSLTVWAGCYLGRRRMGSRTAHGRFGSLLRGSHRLCSSRHFALVISSFKFWAPNRPMTSS